MFNELKWLSFPTICIYYTNVMIVKSLNNQTPTYVKEPFLITLVNSYIRIIHVLMLLLVLSISCHHLHPHPPNM